MAPDVDVGALLTDGTSPSPSASRPPPAAKGTRPSLAPSARRRCRAAAVADRVQPGCAHARRHPRRAAPAAVARAPRSCLRRDGTRRYGYSSSGELKLQHSSHIDRIWSMATLGDTTFASASSDKTVRVWKLVDATGGTPSSRATFTRGTRSDAQAVPARACRCSSSQSRSSRHTDSVQCVLLRRGGSSRAPPTARSSCGTCRAAADPRVLDARRRRVTSTRPSTPSAMSASAADRPSRSGRPTGAADQSVGRLSGACGNLPRCTTVPSGHAAAGTPDES